MSFDVCKYFRRPFISSGDPRHANPKADVALRSYHIQCIDFVDCLASTAEILDMLIRRQMSLCGHIIYNVSISLIVSLAMCQQERIARSLMMLR
ncbi:hypothetical protein QE152_g27476 [Popillia japonica]|uniref:Uncharacterized protein n=1 Tax=Popillia japonica TaxID=7064 RepID=A0AAW1JVL4_POPJA